MEKQSSLLEDDRQAFTAVQLERYLKRKRVGRFCSQVERDVILDIIEARWEELEKSSGLSQMDTDRKMNAFYHLTVVFPYFVAEEESLIPVNFSTGRRFEAEESCFCGSGEPVRQCCGSLSSVKDLLFGSE